MEFLLTVAVAYGAIGFAAMLVHRPYEDRFDAALFWILWPLLIVLALMDVGESRWKHFRKRSQRKRKDK